MRPRPRPPAPVDDQSVVPFRLLLVFLLALVLLAASFAAGFAGASNANAAHAARGVDKIRKQLDAGCDCDMETDVLVVGLGPAGSSAVWRIMHDFPNVSVIAIEKGGDPTRNPLESYDPYVPANAGNLITRRPDLFTGGAEITRIGPPPRPHMVGGKGPGGGSLVNGLQVVQQSRVVNEEQAAVLGNPPDWSHASLYAELKELEQYTGPGVDRGLSGPQPVTRTNPTVLGSIFAEAVNNALGFPTITDYNGPEPAIGALEGWDLITIPDYSRRADSYTSMIVNQGLLEDPRLTVLLEHTATTIRWVRTGPRPKAVAMNVLQPDGTTMRICFKKLILAAQQANVQILEQSGYGKAEILSAYGVPIVYDNQWLGENMLNHWGYFSVFVAPANITGVLNPNELYAGGLMAPLPEESPTLQKRSVQKIVIGGGGGFAVFTLWNTRNITAGQRAYLHMGTRAGNDVPVGSEGIFEDPIDYAVFRQIVREYDVPLANWLAANYPGVVMIDPPPNVIADDTLLDAWFKSNARQGFHNHNTTGLGYAIDKRMHAIGVDNVLVTGQTAVSVPNDGNMWDISKLLGSKAGRYAAEEI